MNLLEGVQTLHAEAKLPGTAPDSVEGQSGRAADLVRWYIEAYNDIQRAKAGRWKWLRKGFTLDTVANTISYAYSACTDVATGQPISRFRAWDLNDDEPPLIFLVSEGQATERQIALADWPLFRYQYVRGTHTANYPNHLAVDVGDLIYLGPKPNGVYRVSGNYWRSNQVLAANDDEPEMPADYHMLIVYRAIVKYAYNTVSHEVLARAKAEGDPLYDALSTNQSYALFQIRTASALGEE